MAAKKTLAIILGAGSGTGSSLGLAFSKLHSHTILLARNAQSLESVAESIKKQGGGSVRALSCDVTSTESVDKAFDTISKEYSDHLVKVAVFNANSPFIVKPFLELSEGDMKTGIDLNVLGAFKFSQKVIPLMLQTGGTLIFSGATAALKGSAKFAAFSPSKFALRGFSQSLAREFGPLNIHVAHAIIDGLIDTKEVSKYMGSAEEGIRINPDAIAEAYVYLSEQPKSCWTQELDLRPFAEKF